MINGTTNAHTNLRDWTDLGADEQIAVREEYGHYLDGLPPTCSMQTKNERFRDWLREHKGIEYAG